MDEQEIVETVSALVDREHELRRMHAAGEPLGDAERVQLDAIEVQLDQCWDLLRQRRARREFDGDVDAAKVRDADVVEHYRQ
jgi:hypothetical protein